MSEQQRRSLRAPGKVELDQALWCDDDLVPPTDAVLSWTPEALTCRMVQFLAEPLARHTEPNDPVHTDNCLEWFLAPWPGTGLYLNLEANALGTFYAAFGTTEERPLLSPALRRLVGCRVEQREQEWEVTWTVPAELLDGLAALAGRSPVRLEAGTEFETNFYTCGDETERPHYAAWNPIRADTPQYHRPDQFGRLTLS